MQGILREKLLSQAMKLSEVSNMYLKDSSRFVESYISWLVEAEKDLSTIKSPISIVLQAEKSLILSVADGYIPEFVNVGKNFRKIQRAVTAKSIEKVSRELYTKIETTDHILNELNEKICHAVAVACSKNPDLLLEIQTNKINAEDIWHILGTTPETVPMYNYFTAKVSAIDWAYLLASVIHNVESYKLLNHAK